MRHLVAAHLDLVFAKASSDHREGMVRRRRRLRGWIGDEEYRAMLHPDGRITVDGEDHRSPTGAARAATDRRRSGWNFWHLKGADKEWRPLKTLRRERSRPVPAR